MDRRGWAVRAAVALAPFVVFAAFPLPIPALPAIGADLRVGTAELQLLVSGYALGLGALLVPGGVLVDRWGPTRVWIAAMAGCAASSGLCALAPTAGLLVCGRIGQGVAGAGLLAGSLALVATAVPAARRSAATALWGAAIGAGLALGPLAGALGVELGHWRAALVALAVVAAVAAGLGLLLLPGTSGSGSARIDVLGAACLAGGTGALILAIGWIGTGGWGSPRVLLGLAVAAALLVGFAVGQRRSARPMVDAQVLGQRVFLGGLVAGLALAASALSMMVVIGPYLQLVLGASALALALWFLPFTGTAFAVALLGARLADRLPLRTRLVTGLGLSGAGMLALLPVDPGWTWPWLLPGMALVGVGVGMANPALALAVVAPVPPQHSGTAAGVANTARQLGNALGIAVLGAALQAGAAGAARAGTDDTALVALIAAGDPSGQVGQLYDTAQTAGVRAALLVAIAICAVGMIGTHRLTRPLRGRE